MEFVKQIYNVFVGKEQAIASLRNKNTVPGLLTNTDQEIFASMHLGDCWEDASVASVYWYLRRGQHLVIPNTWQSTMAAFEQALNAKVHS